MLQKSSYSSSYLSLFSDLNNLNNLIQIFNLFLLYQPPKSHGVWACVLSGWGLLQTVNVYHLLSTTLLNFAQQQQRAQSCANNEQEVLTFTVADRNHCIFYGYYLLAYAAKNNNNKWSGWRLCLDFTDHTEEN